MREASTWLTLFVLNHSDIRNTNTVEPWFLAGAGSWPLFEDEALQCILVYIPPQQTPVQDYEDVPPVYWRLYVKRLCFWNQCFTWSEKSCAFWGKSCSSSFLIWQTEPSWYEKSVFYCVYFSLCIHFLLTSQANMLLIFQNFFCDHNPSLLTFSFNCGPTFCMTYIQNRWLCPICVFLCICLLSSQPLL